MASSERKLVIETIHDRAEGYSRNFAKLARSADIRKDGFQEITYRQLLSAVDRCAWLLDDHLQQSADFATFAFLGGSTDMRYILLLFAAMKTRRKVFFTSPRNSLAAHLSLLDKTDCHIFLAPTNPHPIIDTILAERPMKLVRIPDIEELLAGDGSPYPLKVTYDKNLSDPCCVLHTSGSTGIPKPVVLAHHYFSTEQYWKELPSLGLNPSVFENWTNIDSYVPFPFFHSAGLTCNSARVVAFDWTAIIGPSVPLTAEHAKDVIQHTHPTITLLPPAIFKEMAENPKYLHTLRDVSLLAYGGGPLSTPVGSTIAKDSHLINLFGMTEFGAAPVEAVDPEDWEYIKFSPALGGQFHEVAPDQYELVIHRDDKLIPQQAIFYTYPELHEWPTRDLYSPHPSKPNLWRYRGRADDVIVFSTGEKLNPLSIESIVTAHPKVSGALVTGEGKFQSGLLVEPREALDTDDQRATLLAEIWPTIEEANRDTVAHGKVSMDFVLFATSSKPFARASKGSVQRATTIESYKDDIEAMYEDRERLVDGTSNDFLDITTNKVSARAMLRHRLIPQLGRDSVTDDTDLFTIGMDSLQVNNLVRMVNLAAGRHLLTQQDIYTNHTINKLATLLVDDGNMPHISSSALRRVEQMQQIFDQLSKDLHITTRLAQPSPERRYTIVLTGSTGSLGSYLLHSLIRNAAIEHIHCINRDANAAATQRDKSEARGLTTEFDRVSFHHSACFSLPYLGLTVEEYKAMLASTTHIIHNAWPVNFNMSLESFLPNMQGVRRLIDFATSSTYAACLHFVGSVASVINFPIESLVDGKVPEEPTYDWSVASESGYGESKLLSSSLIAKANKIANLDATVMRVGQIAGPVKQEKGMWPKNEWLPSLIASSLHLGVLPQDLGAHERVDWMPVDVLADVFIQLVLESRPSGFLPTDKATTGASGRYVLRNLANPRYCAWADLVPTIVDACKDGRKPRLVSYREWLSHLQQSASEVKADADLNANPAVKLIPFLKSLDDREAPVVTLETTETSKGSDIMKIMAPVQKEWMARWMEQWNFQSESPVNVGI